MADSDIVRLTDHVSLGALTRIVPRHVIDEVLAETGSVEKRSRLLPAHVVVYFVLALSLFTDGYEEVIRKMVHGLRFARTWSTRWTVPSTGALSQARRRLGERPLQAIFEAVAVPVAKPGTPGAWLNRWRLMAIDGVMIDMPDTPENREVFHKPEGGTRRPFPQSRTVGLVEIGSHAVVAVQIGTIRTGERELAGALTGALTPDMLVVADRGFYSFDLWRAYHRTGAQLLWRMSAGVRLPVLAVLPDGSYLSEITNQARVSRGQQDPHRRREHRRPVPGNPHPGAGHRVPDRWTHRRRHAFRDVSIDHQRHRPRPRQRHRSGRHLPATMGNRIRLQGN